MSISNLEKRISDMEAIITPAEKVIIPVRWLREGKEPETVKPFRLPPGAVIGGFVFDR